MGKRKVEELITDGLAKETIFHIEKFSVVYSNYFSMLKLDLQEEVWPNALSQKEKEERLDILGFD